MTRTDRAALKLALARCREQSPGRAAQIDDLIKDEVWERVAEFAATSCQNRSLNLAPWQVAPCDFTDDDLARDYRRGGHAALALLRRMEQRGVSKFHPDPVAACEAAEAKTAPP